MEQRPHISICVCTYKRPELLARLLEGVEAQAADNLFTRSVVVVDNDRDESARGVVLAAQKRGRISIDYIVEAEQNISVARNRAIRNAKGDLVAIIDDDVLPKEDWLPRLFSVYKDLGVDGVLGHVRPYFTAAPPEWIKKGGFFEKGPPQTGAPVEWKDANTENLLAKRAVFEGGDDFFDPAFGKTGGEDTDFFKRVIKKGCRFVWCREAVCYEITPPERCTAGWLLRRALRSGAIYAKIVSRDAPLAYKVFFVSRALACLAVFSAALPFSILLGRHLFVRVMMKMASDIGKILGSWGVGIIGYG